MSYAYLNREYMKNKPKFWLCLPYPRRTGIRKLTEIYNVDIKFILGRVHELSFDISTKVERNHELIPNELIKLFEGYYQVKMDWNGQTEYFVYVRGNRKLDNSGKSLSYKLYSTSYLIGKKSVPIYEETSKNLRFHAEHFLEDTNWTIGDIDSELDNTYREITASQSNALQCLYDLCDKFEAVMEFDTVNQIVHFRKPENIGINKGMTFRDGITLESLGQEIDYDKIITRLHVYGSDGLEFRRLSAVGVNYLQDLTWFLHPFEQDANGNVIKSSKWLTDDFCVAYLAYKDLLATQQPIFESLVADKTSREDSKIQSESDLSLLEFELNQAENELWVYNKTYKENAPSHAGWQNAMNRKNNLTARINSKNSEVANWQSQIDALDAQINNVRVTLLLENNFTLPQIVEMKEFIHTGYYTNDAITSDEDLMEDGIVAFKKVNQPPITINLSIVNFMNDVKFEKLKDRIVLGDTVKVKSEDLDVYVSLKIIEITYNLENDNINLTISNEKDLRDDMSKLVDEIYSSSHTSNMVETNKGNWDKGGEAYDKVIDISTNPWDSAKNSIFGGYLNTTTLDKYGLKSVDSDNPSTFLFINDGVFSISENNGDTIKVAIDKDGIRAKVIYGELILSNDMKIISDSGVIEIDGDTLRVKENGNVKVELGKYIDKNNQTTYGLNIIGGAFNLRTSPNSNEGTVIDEDGIRVYDSSGNVVFDTSNGDNLEYNGSVNLSGETEVRGRLIFRDTTTGEGSIYYNNGDLTFETHTRFRFYGDVFVMGTGAEMYIDGRKVLTEP